MSVLPRTLLITAVVLVGLSPVASAGPEACIEMILANYASGLRIIANTGDSIALGFASGYPGDGVGYVAIITPSLCTGIDLEDASQSGLSDLQGVLQDLPELLPLP